MDISKEAKFFKIGIVVGEASGDVLGAELIEALEEQISEAVQWVGIAGDRMADKGVVSLFPLEDISVMGITAVIPKIPLLIKRINQTVNYLVEEEVDGIILIDSPDFTQRVAKKFHKKKPDIPIIGYVSPSVWAWRPGRAKAMAQYMSHLMALLPFEPEAHQKLGGPPCSYVGHPLLEKIEDARYEEARDQNTLLLLPGSRKQEIINHLELFKNILDILKDKHGISPKILMPTLERRKRQIEEYVQDWHCDLHITTDDDTKWESFKTSNAALAVSGTVTLELGVMNVPTIVVYKLSFIERMLRFMVSHLQSIVLTNLVIGKNVYPEFVDLSSDAEQIAQEVANIWHKGSEARNKQLEQLIELKEIMANEVGLPSERAAQCVATFFALK